MTTTDDGTGRRLKLLVGLVVVAAAGCVALAAWQASFDSKSVIYAAAWGVPLAAAASWPTFRIRVRSQLQALSSGSAVVVAGVAILPWEWLILCMAAAITIAKLAARVTPLKSAFNIGKDVLAASAAAGAAALAGLNPLLTLDNATDPTWQQWVGQIPALAVAAAAYAVVDDGLAAPVLALASGDSWRKFVFAEGDIRFLARLGNFIVAITAAGLAFIDPRLIVGMPLAVWAVHLLYSARIRSRHEVESWQRLAQTTDKLNVVDLDTLVRSAATQSPQLFSADESEVVLWRSDRLVRGSAGAITYDGSADEAPPAKSFSITAPLVGNDGSGDLGELRLRFRGPVKLSERENYKLRTFASALAPPSATPPPTPSWSGSRSSTRTTPRTTRSPAWPTAGSCSTTATEVLAGQRPTASSRCCCSTSTTSKRSTTPSATRAGDQVLIQVGRPAQARPRTDGDLVARLGGDEFAVLLTGLPAPAVATHRAERLLRGPARADRGRRHADQRRGQRRHRDRAEHRRHRRAAAPRRRRDVPGQALRPADRHLRARPRHRRRRPAHARRRPAPRGRRARVHRQLPADRRPRQRRGGRRRGAGPLAPPRPRHRRPAAVPGDGRAQRPAAGVRRGRARPGADRRRHLAGGRLRPAGRGQRLAAQPARPAVPRRRAWPACAPTTCRPTGSSSS